MVSAHHRSTFEKGIFSFHCCERVSRKMKETQQQLNDFERSATLQSNSSLLNNSLLIIKPGCCQSALECFHKNLWEVTHPSTRDSTLLFSSLRNTLMPSCLVAALECVIKELWTAKSECEDEGFNIDLITGNLDSYVKGLHSVNSRLNSTECVCEKWPVAPWKDFLTNMTSLLQMYATVIKSAAASF
ncbi:unnamed protein product [Lota lota]